MTESTGLSKVAESATKTLSSVMSRRDLIKRGAILGASAPIIAGLLAACGDDDDDIFADPPAPTDDDDDDAPVDDDDEPADEPADDDADDDTADVPAGEGGHFTMAMIGSSEPANLDAQIDPFRTAVTINSFCTDFPVWLSDAGEYDPQLLDSWEMNEDATEWTLHFRDDGVMFTDGTPFNGEAFVANMERIFSPDVPSALRADQLGQTIISEMNVLDEFTVELIYSSPMVDLINAFSFMPVWSPTAFEEYGVEGFQDHLIGCGPFILTEWERATHVRFVNNPDYMGRPPTQRHEGPAFFDSAEVIFVGEEAILGEVMRTGEADLVYNLPAQSVAGYVDDPDFVVEMSPQGGSGWGHILQTEREPLDDVNVRRALRHAYDPQRLNDILYDGLYVTMHGPLQPVTRCYWAGAEDYYEFDPELSRQLLDEAGWDEIGGDGIRVKDGERLSLVSVITGNEPLQELLGTFFRDVGVELLVEVVPGPVQLERGVGGDFDLMIVHLSGIEAEMLHRLYHSANLREGGWSWGRYQDEELDGLLDAGLQSVDPAERCEHFEAAQEIIVDQVLSLPSLGQPIAYGMSARLQGFRASAEPRTGVYVWEMSWAD
jgi:peptide/nickel transport system substrate-binding protein